MLQSVIGKLLDRRPACRPKYIATYVSTDVDAEPCQPETNGTSSFNSRFNKNSTRE